MTNEDWLRSSAQGTLLLEYLLECIGLAETNEQAYSYALVDRIYAIEDWLEEEH